jgi:UDP-glucose 4-epimerase
MKLLVLGASGFIGHAAMEYFSIRGTVTGIDRVDLFSRDIIITEDISVVRQLIREQGFDVILNCAGSSDVKGSFHDPEHDFALNVGFVQAILTAIKNTSPHTKFINFSSAAVYGNALSLPIRESDPLKPISPYGFHKMLSEQLVQEYHDLFKVRALSLRIFSAYGNGLKRQFIYDLYCKFMADPASVVLYGTGNESRDFIFIDDIMLALETLIHKASFEGEAYNVAGGSESFIHETSRLFADICAYQGNITFRGEQIEGYPINWRADITPLKALGFEPQTTMPQGLEHYYQWIKQHFGT